MKDEDIKLVYREPNEETKKHPKYQTDVEVIKNAWNKSDLDYAIKRDKEWSEINQAASKKEKCIKGQDE
jgi:hypothetical protein